MEQTIIINIHSMIDVITNSSSELFICDIDKSVEAVKEILEELRCAYEQLENAGIDFDNYKVIDFYSVFGRIERIEDINSLYDFITGWDNSMPKFWQMNKSYEETKKLENMWFKEHKKELEEKYLGKIIIESAKDNSIPYELFDRIESIFNASRYHLG
jgi:hypothetical protein